MEEYYSEDPYDAPQFRSLACEAACQRIVLLKNDKHILPLKGIQKLAVIGPNVNVTQLGGYSANQVKGFSPLEGIKVLFDNREMFSYKKTEDGSAKWPFNQAFYLI